jgi:hypothetical protein
VDADRGDVQFTARGALVERLDVLQDVFKAPAVRWDKFFRQRVEHEGVIRVRRMPERQRALCHG